MSAELSREVGNLRLEVVAQVDSVDLKEQRETGSWSLNHVLSPKVGLVSFATGLFSRSWSTRLAQSWNIAIYWHIFNW